MARGRFITFEGIDGAGKSTQIAAVVQCILLRELKVIQSREPGGTPLGEKIRSMVLNDSMHLETETLLMFAGRRQHLAEVIEPALDQGTWVVSDRFSDATFAYQVGGRGLPEEKFIMLEQWVHPHLQPDMTFLFDVQPAIAAQRLAAGREKADRFEREQSDFFERVRAAYLQRAQQSNGRIVIIDASRIPELITADVVSYLKGLFE